MSDVVHLSVADIQALADDLTYALDRGPLSGRLMIDEGGVQLSFKFNEAVWSYPPLGEVRP